MCHVVPLSAQRSKMSAYLRQLTMPTTTRRASKAMGQQAERMTTVLVKTTDRAVLDGRCRMLHSWGDVHAVMLPVSELQRLAAMPQVLRIEANGPCELTNDTAAHVTNVQHNPLYPTVGNDVRGEYGLTGKGVVVGVVDVGFDLTHPSYLTPGSDRCRVSALWDQLDQTKDGGEMAIGREYTGAEQIAAKRHTADALLTSHGTHTSNTAAGSGMEGLQRQSIYGGMAPEADICLVSNYVSTNKDLVPAEQQLLYTTATDLLGFQYIIDYAASMGKPCVINFSEGRHQDLDENQLHNEVLSQMVGPGRIICCSAGNEGQKGSYMYKAAGTEQVGAFLTSSGSEAYYTLRSTAPIDVRLCFYGSDGSTTEWRSDTHELEAYPDSLFADTVSIGERQCAILYVTYPACFGDDRYATELLIQDLQSNRIGSAQCTVSMLLCDKDNDIEAFASGGYFGTSTIDAGLKDFSYDHNILFPGSAPDVVCVGNSSFRTTFLNADGDWCTLFGTEDRDGMISRHSSVGPTMEGLTKPDVSAPGMNIISALSTWYDEAKRDRDSDVVGRFSYGGRTYGWWAESGTSMSSPVVAGIVALWLELCPTLSPEDIKEVFEHTCSHPTTTAVWPNNQYGHGNIDALAGARYIAENMVTGISAVNGNSAPLRPGTFDLSGRTSDGKRPGLYIINGKLTLRK